MPFLFVQNSLIFSGFKIQLFLPRNLYKFWLLRISMCNVHSMTTHWWPWAACGKSERAKWHEMKTFLYCSCRYSLMDKQFSRIIKLFPRYTPSCNNVVIGKRKMKKSKQELIRHYKRWVWNAPKKRLQNASKSILLNEQYVYMQL